MCDCVVGPEKRTRQGHDSSEKRRGGSDSNAPPAKKKKTKTLDIDLPDAPRDGLFLPLKKVFQDK